MKSILSKSQYTGYIRCPKLFWLSRRDRSKLSPPSIMQRQLRERGEKVGIAAQSLFPGGIAIPFVPEDLSGMAKRTQELISEGADTIFDASFMDNDLFAAIDILRYSEGKWHIYEVKSSTGVRDYYIDDASLQFHILLTSGLEVGSVNIVRINNAYVRQGELDVHRLFSIRDITEPVLSRQQHIPHQIAGMRDVLGKGEPEMPIGPYCLSPFECAARAYCWKHIPDKSVFTLTRAPLDEKFALYSKGLTNVARVPLENRTMMQRLQIRGELFLDRTAVRDFLSSLDFPLSHLDFECFQHALPEYDGEKPFSQIPFQYSVHIERETALEHREFLGPVGTDPRRSLAEKLLRDIPREGTVLAFNAGFEKGVIRRLAALFEDLAPPLLSLVDRMRDLMIPFQKGWYYHPDMNGSYSIKKVLPALVPGMGEAYDNLPVVHNGGEASSLWVNLPSLEDPAKVAEIRKGLLEYCRLDTLAMVEILKVLRNV